MDVNMILPIWRSCNFSFNTFFQIQKPLGLIQNWVQFHVDITHSPMLDIIWIIFFVFNFEVEPTCQFFKKKINVLTLKDLPLFSKMLFHGFNFESKPNKRLIPMFGFCANSNKKMWSWVWVTKTCLRALGFNIGN